MTTVETLRTQLAVAQLAETLATSTAALAPLTSVPADDLAVLRHGLADGLTAHHEAVFDAFARASGLVPTVLAATITRRMIGPSLAGRIAGSLPPERAVALLGHLDVPFLADCCRTLSPRAAAQLVPRVDEEVLVATTRELARRDDHATLGRFVDVLDDGLLQLVLDALTDPRHLLLAGAAVDAGPALDRVVRLLPPPRRRALVRVAPEHPDAAANVLVRVRPGTRALLLDATTGLDSASIVDLVDAVTATMHTAPALRRAGRTLPRDELADAAQRLATSPAAADAVGRLVATVRTIEEHDP
jgi:hypothetical protein